ncbi:MAG: class I SAM-dependent methyltransferase [Nitrososphaerota archaeon]|nr:methyltransferase domain-containing protein [Aigarchaeota archaeon]MDW8076572.1 class I SAM-dependent methyltransferase [Nitrososphaerota archaeon]
MSYSHISKKSASLKIPFYPSPVDVVKLMLELVSPKEGQILVDLGCGDGRILVEAASNYECSVVGVESNPLLASYAYNKLIEKGIRNFRIVRGDLFKFDVSPADVITLYLTSDALRILKPKLELYSKPGAKIITHDFSVPGWEPLVFVSKVSAEDGRLHRLYLYEVGKSFRKKIYRTL